MVQNRAFVLARQFAFRITTRLVGTVAAVSLALFAFVEISIDGGYRTVVLPSGLTESPAAQETIAEFHLDDPVIIRWWHWLVDVVNGDFGRSNLGDDSVTELITHRLPISGEIMILGVVFTVLIGIPLGLAAVATHRNPIGRLFDAIIALSQGLPVYVTPLFLVTYATVRNQWLPSSGWVRISESLTGNLTSLVLPMIALVFSQIGELARVVKSDVTSVLGSDFVVAARGKGLSRRYVLFRHALRPASVGVLNVLGLNIGTLLSGALVIELIFGIGGLGQLLLEASLNRDLYVLVGVTTYVAVVHVVISTVIDQLLQVLDPRITR